MICPACGTTLVPVSRHAVAYQHCPGCGGAWLDTSAIAQLAQAVPSPDVSPARPASKRFEDRAPGEGAGHGTRFGGAYSRVKPDAPKSLIDDIFAPGSD